MVISGVRNTELGCHYVVLLIAGYRGGLGVWRNVRRL